ncbi:TldD/PmbA family protein [Dermatobacter hominis]|uniref:TldD/PmbA family protein n=1 Tax=Dermatobacter hominis TaxID=2884263 RepID=UPI001D1100CE|nr:TldD/PmbA family protein [Dermatobacter hominis]UDY34857.1 TldD/PmbA family protein [Dermatobacter hominis]
MTVDGQAELLELGRKVLADAGAGEQVEIVLGRSTSTSVKVFGGEVESLTSASSDGAGIRVLRDGRQGFAHCGSLEPDVLAETLAEARDNCAFGEPDEFNGLAEDDGVPVVPQESWSDAVVGLPNVDKVELALELERRTLAIDPRVTTARTTSYGDGWGESAVLSTNGIEVVQRGASCSISTSPMARHDGETQIGWAVDASRDPAVLDLDQVAADAVERAVRLLGATKPASSRMTILLEPRLALTLVSLVAGMLGGDAVLKGRSPFADRVGEEIASPLLTFVDDPTRAESIAAEEHDGEGLACRRNDLVVDGVLHGFLHDSYTGRRSGVGSTASAVRGVRSLPGVGAQLLVMSPGTRSFDELVASIDHGLYVTSFAGLHSGVNPVSGDFSVGADGLLIEGGALGAPVREMTIASTLQRLLLDIREVGGDFEWTPGGSGACSLVIDDVSVSGS